MQHKNVVDLKNVACMINAMEDRNKRIMEVAEMRGRLKTCGITISEMCDTLKMSRATWSRWAAGADRLQSKWDAVCNFVEKHEKPSIEPSPLPNSM